VSLNQASSRNEQEQRSGKIEARIATAKRVLGWLDAPSTNVDWENTATRDLDCANSGIHVLDTGKTLETFLAEAGL
jgi:hypothetical protein